MNKSTLLVQFFRPEWNSVVPIHNFQTNRIALGAAQYGMKYGIANTSSGMSDTEISKIIEYARLNGIDTIDTAVSYGDSELLLGQVGVSDFDLITKLPPISADAFDIKSYIIYTVQNSLKKMNSRSLYALLLHKSSDLLNYADPINSAVEILTRDGLIQKFGISIYCPSELDDVFHLANIDLVQSPLNVFDHRLVSSGWLTKLANCGVEVHARSVFLQGLLIMDRIRRPKYFNKWKSNFESWDDFIDVSGYTAKDVCLSYVFKYPDIARVVIGCDNFKQFADIIESISAFDSRLVNLKIPNFTQWDENLINPSLWQT